MLPALVAPKPDFGLAANGFLQALHEVGRELPIGDLAGIAVHQLKGSFIMSAAFALHIKIEESGIQFFANSLCTCEAGRVLMEKIYPNMNIDNFRTLIGYEAADDFFPFRLETENFPQNQVLIDVVRMKMIAELQKELVEETITDWFVELAGINAFTEPYAERRDPFPIAIMAEIDENEVVVAEKGFNFGDVGEIHPTAYVCLGHSHEFERFHTIIAEIVVETVDDAASLFRCLFGKGAFHIAADYSEAVAYEIAYDEVENIGDDVE